MTKHTRQGVRDLNGPRMDGVGYNGRLIKPRKRLPFACVHIWEPIYNYVWDPDYMEWFRATVKYRCGFCNAEKTA